MRSTITSFVVFAAACLANAEKKKCSSVFPSSSSLAVFEPSTVSGSFPSSTGSTVSSSQYSPIAINSPTDSTSESVSLASSESIASISGSSSISNSAGGGSTTSTDSSPAITSPATTVSSPATVIVVTNDVGNGNFGSYDASSPGGIANWDSQNCEINLNYGYQGSGSSDTGCVQMAATDTTDGRATKREDYTAMIEQQLQSVDETSDYTIRFWYTILSNSLANTCRMEAYYGDVLLTQSAYFEVVTDAVPGNTPWLELVDEVALSSSDGYIRFQLSCTGDGTAVVFIDEVFVSNKIGATSSNNISLLFTSTGSLTSSTSTTTTSTSTTESTTTTESTSSSTSETSTSSSSASSSSTTSSEAISSSTTSSLSSTTSSISVSLASSAAAGTPTLCVASAAASATAGLTCGRNIYSNKAAYKTVSVPDLTRDQCAAACLADSNCLSISYYSTVSCSAVCYLQSASVANMGYSYSGGQPQVWDKGCFAATACAEPTAGQVCVDRIGSSPASSCKATFMGKAKSCATPFATASVSPLCGSGACQQLCKQYPSCKTYSATYGGTVTCNFYSGDISSVAESSSSSTIFSDMSCFECGSGSSVFKWLTPLSDPATMPDLSACSAGGSTTSSSSSSTLSSTSSSTVTTSSSTSSTVTTTTTTSSSTTTSASCVTCTAVPSSEAQYYTCGVQGDLQYQDAYGVSTGKQDSMMDCAAICAQDDACWAYGYRANTNPSFGCAFIQTSLQDAGFYSTSTSNYYWSDKGCSSCGSSCSSSSSTSSVEAVSSTSMSTTLSTSTLPVGYSETTSSSTSTSASASASATAACASPTAKLLQGVTCGLPGSAGSSAAAIEEVSAVGSLSTCASRCLADAGCLSFKFSSDSSCSTYSTSMVEDALSYSPSSTNWYYDRECFSCA